MAPPRSRILWLSWKDSAHPRAGGAELVGEHIRTRLAAQGHEIRLLTCAFPGCQPEEQRAGVTIIRRGSRVTVYLAAAFHFHRHLRRWPDLIIEEVNTIPFFSRFYRGLPPASRRVLLFHQLCGRVWWYQVPRVFSRFGYCAEKIYLRFLTGQRAIAGSASTGNDLCHHGFPAANIVRIRYGNSLPPLPVFAWPPPQRPPTVISFGAIRPMKRTLDQLAAYALAKQSIPELRLLVVGQPEGDYGRLVNATIAASPFRQDITFLGAVPENDKAAVFRQADCLLLTPVKEGWGLTVIEAAGQGLPAIAYRSDGLVDSIRDGETGLFSAAATPAALAATIVDFFHDNPRRHRLAEQAWRQAQQFSFDTTVSDFCAAVGEPLVPPTISR